MYGTPNAGEIALGESWRLADQMKAMWDRIDALEREVRDLRTTLTPFDPGTLPPIDNK